MKKKLIFWVLTVFFLLSSNPSFAENTSVDIGEGAEYCEKYAKQPIEKKNVYIYDFTFAAFHQRIGD